MEVKDYETILVKKLGELQTSIEDKLAEGQKSYFDESSEKLKSLEDMLVEVKAKYVEIEEAMSKAKWRDEPGAEGGSKDKFSLFKACQAIASRDFTYAPYEQEVMTAARVKAQAAGVDIAGGFLVPNQALGGIIELLRNNLAVTTLGATMLMDLVGAPVEIPKQTTASTAFWTEENSPISESQIQFGQLQMNPKGLAALVKMSNRSIRLSNPALENLVRTDITEQIALALDLAALRGTGVAGQPLGVVNQPGIVTVDFDVDGAGASSNPSYERAYDMEGVLEDANALKGKLGFVMSPAVKRTFGKLRTGTGAATELNNGQFLQTVPMTSPHISALLGYPFATSTQMPTNIGTGGTFGDMIFGNWADLLIGMWGGMRLMASQEAGTAFASDQTWVRAIVDTDIAIRRVESFTVAIDVKHGAIDYTVTI